MRILLTFLMDPGARPTPRDMKLWVDVIRFIKSGARGGALSFFTYMELSMPAFNTPYSLKLTIEQRSGCSSSTSFASIDSNGMSHSKLR